MKKQGLRRVVVAQFFLVVLVTLLLIETIFVLAVRQYYYNSVAVLLTNHAAVATSYYNKFAGPLYAINLGSQLSDMLNSFEQPKAELQIVDMQGHVLASSTGYAAEGQIQTRDIREAQQGGTGRWSGSLPATGEHVLAVSSPLISGGTPVAIIRYVTSLEPIDALLRRIIAAAIGVGVLVLAAVFLLSLALANSIVNPIREITSVSAEMARGRFHSRVQEGFRYELGHLADTMNVMADEIVKSDKLKTDFISSISHELRTPLTGIKGWTETMLEGPLDNTGETRTGLHMIRKETDRLVGLVEELLDFAKLEQRQLVIARQPVQLAPLLHEIVIQLRAKAQARQLTLDLLAGEEAESLTVTGDGNRLKQVFLNIIDNAIKFSREGGQVSVRLTAGGQERLDSPNRRLISTSQDDYRAIVTVSDHGIGIEAEHLSRVTERFYQAHPQRGGTGLGLAISRELVELHGGTLSLWSELGHGTTVTVSLPAQSSSGSPHSG